ncbi:hypothetical protein HKD37_01G000577 [Glycine soja]
MRYVMYMFMGTPPRSPLQLDGHSKAMSRKTRQSTRLRRLTLRTLDQPRPTINIDAGTGRGSGPHKEKFHNYLGDSLEEQSTQGRVHAVGFGVTISQYYRRASRGSGSSSTSITQQQLIEIIRSHKEEVKNEIGEENKQNLEKLKQELKEAIKIEFFQGDHSARVSTKGSNDEISVNPSREEHVAHVIQTMGLFVQREHSTHLVALRKIYEGGSAIHNDIVRVNVDKVIDGDAQVSFMTSEIQYVRQTLDTFIAWPTHLVKLVSNKLSKGRMILDDPLCDLIKCLYDIYEKHVELLWNGTKFEIPNVDASFFLTYSDANEMISCDKCLDIAILQLWIMFMDDWSCSLGHGSVYGFLEPQLIHNANDRCVECQHYIENWVKESQREGPLATGCFASYKQCCRLVLFVVVTFKKEDLSVAIMSCIGCGT